MLYYHPCKIKHKNLSVKTQERSSNPVLVMLSAIPRGFFLVIIFLSFYYVSVIPLYKSTVIWRTFLLVNLISVAQRKVPCGFLAYTRIEPGTFRVTGRRTNYQNLIPQSFYTPSHTAPRITRFTNKYCVALNSKQLKKLKIFPKQTAYGANFYIVIILYNENISCL